MIDSIDKRLRFEGSLSVNLEIAQRHIVQVFTRVIEPLGLTIIESYILRALYARDGQHASELAKAVGRATTSFTPNLDKLQDKGFIMRRPDIVDRRATHIFLTKQGEEMRGDVLRWTQYLDEKIQNVFEPEEFEVFQKVLGQLQSIEPEDLGL